MVYVDGEATMDTYQDAEGKTRKSLSIVQRMLPSNFSLCTMSLKSPNKADILST